MSIALTAPSIDDRVRNDHVALESRRSAACARGTAQRQNSRAMRVTISRWEQRGTRQTISCGRSSQKYGLRGALTAARRKWPKASK